MNIQHGVKNLCIQILGLPDSDAEFNGTLGLDEEATRDNFIQLTTAIRDTEQAINRRMTGENRLITAENWTAPTPPDGQGYTIMMSDINKILNECPHKCEHCGAIGAGIQFSRSCREFGDASTYLIDGISDYETNDSEGDGNEEFTCRECSDGISGDNFIIGQEALTQLQTLASFIKGLCETHGEIERQVTQDGNTFARIINPSAGAFANGIPDLANNDNNLHSTRRALSEDTPTGRHGPNGNIGNHGNIISSPQDFAFRDQWICDKCEYRNSQINVQCGKCKQHRYATI